MKTLVEITFKPSNTYVSGVTATGTNVSHTDQLDEPSRGFKGFHFAQNQGEWPANMSGSYKYYPDEGYSGFVSQALSQADGTVDVSIVFTIQGSVPEYLTITFDAACNEFATQFRVTNNQNSIIVNANNNRYKTFVNILSMNLSDGAVITVQILKWNKPFKNVKISQITFGYSNTYTDNDIEEFKCSEQMMPEQFKISIGIIEQYLDITFRDRYEEFNALASANFLTDNLPVTVSIIQEDGTQVVIGTYNTDVWDIDGTSNIIPLTCKDTSRIFDQVTMPPIEVANRTIHDWLVLHFGFIPATPWRYIDTATQTYCQNISIPNSWLYGDTLRSNLNKVCAAGMLCVYWYVDTFIVARGY